MLRKGLFSINLHSMLPSLKYFMMSQVLSQPGLRKLDLSLFNGGIRMVLGDTIPNSELVTGLQAVMQRREIVEVDVSRHSEMTDLEFSRFRKLLPKLQKITLKEIKPEACRITADQFCKYYAKNILIEAEPELMLFIQNKVVPFLITNNQAEYANTIATAKSGITADNLDATKFQAAIDFAEQRRQMESKQYQEKRIIESAKELAAREKLFDDYQKKIGFDIESKWVKEGPAKQSDFSIYTPNTLQAYTLYLVITQLNLWSTVAKGPGDGGFMFTSPKELDRVYDHPAVRSCGHSGYSLAYFMRLMEMIAIQGSFIKPADLVESNVVAKISA